MGEDGDKGVDMVMEGCRWDEWDVAKARGCGEVRGDTGEVRDAVRWEGCSEVFSKSVHKVKQMFCVCSSTRIKKRAPGRIVMCWGRVSWQGCKWGVRNVGEMRGTRVRWVGCLVRWEGWVKVGGGGLLVVGPLEWVFHHRRNRPNGAGKNHTRSSLI